MDTNFATSDFLEWEALSGTEGFDREVYAPNHWLSSDAIQYFANWVGAFSSRLFQYLPNIPIEWRNPNAKIYPFKHSLEQSDYIVQGTLTSNHFVALVLSKSLKRVAIFNSMESGQGYIAIVNKFLENIVTCTGEHIELDPTCPYTVLANTYQQLDSVNCGI